MKWHLVGYFPKRRLTRANWRSVYAAYPDAAFPAPEPVEEICSVSRCIAGGPDYGPDDAPNTAFDGYGSLDAARQAIGPELRREFDVFAYRLLSTLFRDGHAEEMDIPPLEVEPMPPIFECLGYDAAELIDGNSWGCSPLSCNGQTDGVTFNRYCLVKTAAEGVELARHFSISKPEPGPYGVVEVWRERETGGAGASED